MRTFDRVTGILTQVIVVALHIQFFALFFVFDSNLKLAIMAGDLGYPVVYFVISALGLALFAAVSLKNPGYVARHDPETGVMLQDGPDGPADEADPRDLDGDMEGEDVHVASGRVRYCGVCGVDQALRTKHCRKCERCVGRFDHHCFFINNCVGEGNAALFWWYLFVETIACLWTLKLTVSCLSETDAVASWFYVNGWPLLSLLVIIGFTLVPLSLCVLHTFLAATGQTTWEMFSRKRISYLKDFPEWAYPFSQGGVFRNLRVFCCQLPQLSGRWAVPDAVSDEHRLSVFASRHHNCC